ncbi:hypothetical protein Cgig2_006649 [Carnegiea gigantea]|uniref:Uncharacterized protein n=1 Tax=Carnegiea gigantea TaxID=171969 RepID=A0A9Q1GVY6_9CARY|nr:hypothetical protein Cgig2_006649 [Carnegiea gigantea]
MWIGIFPIMKMLAASYKKSMDFSMRRHAHALKCPRNCQGLLENDESGFCLVANNQSSSASSGCRMQMGFQFIEDSKEELVGDIKEEEDQDEEEDDQAPQADPSDSKSNSDKYLYKQASEFEYNIDVAPHRLIKGGKKNETSKGGQSVGPKLYVIRQLVVIEMPEASKKPDIESKRYFKLVDISAEKA